MRREYFTANPAYPHPDSEHEDPPPMELWRAVVFALKTLRDPNASQQARNFAADELEISFNAQDQK